MTSDVLTDTARQAVMLGLETVGPLLLVILVVGLVVGTLQAATQIQDQSVGFVVRLLAVVVSRWSCCCRGCSIGWSSIRPTCSSGFRRCCDDGPLNWCPG